MNEKVKELLTQATYDVLGVKQVDQEKFADLIVRDCLKQIYGRTKISFPEHSWSDKEIGFNEGVDAAYKQVKKHFGIK